MGQGLGIPVGLVGIPGVKYNPNPCCAYKRAAFYNKTVTSRVVAANGVPVQLTAAGVQKIQAVYDGSPIRIRFTVKQKCCDGCQLCGGGGGCSCIPTIVEPAMATHIWFGDKDREAKCPGCLSLPCVVCCFNCVLSFDKTFVIDHSEASVVVEGGSSIAVGPESQIMPK